MKNIILSTLIFFTLLTGVATAKDITIEVTPVNKITTGDSELAEGDFVDFKVTNSNPKLKKDTLITGLITHIEPNGFAGKEAYLLIEQFKVKTNGQKLKGSIHLQGNSHNQIMEFKEPLLLPTMYVRGGEITLKPNKDVFMLFMED